MGYCFDGGNDYVNATPITKPASCVSCYKAQMLAL